MAGFESVDHDPFSSGGTVTIPAQGGQPTRVIMDMSKGSKFEPVDHDPFATDYGATAKDVAKSAGIGVAKGTLGLAGFAGDVSNALAKGSQAATNYIAEKTGLDPGPQAGETMLPTSASLQKNVEGVTGEFYKPQTTPGHYAETVGEFLPAAVAGPGGVARKIGLQAVLPGVASETAGQATEGTALEPWARAGAGIAAGLGGAVVGRPSQSVKTIRQQFQEAGVTPQIMADARKLMNSGVQLTWPEALSKAAGRPILTDKLRVLESDPVTSGRMAAFFADRPQQVDAAGMKAISEISPATGDPFQIGPQVGKAAQGEVKDVRQAINKASEPYYKNAEAQLFSPQEFAVVQTIPGYKESLEAVRKAPDAWRIEHLPDNSVGVLNKVKQHFDELAENAGSKFSQGKSQSVQSSHEMSASATKQVGIAKSADYETALEIQKQGREKFLDPLLQGPLGRLAKKDVTTQKAIEALFPSNPLPNSHEVIADTVSALAKKNPGAASQLVRAHVESVFNEATQSLTGGPAQWGGAKFSAILTGNPQQRANLKAAIEALPHAQTQTTRTANSVTTIGTGPSGKEIWRGFEGFLDAMEAIGTRQAKGSLTAFNPDQLKSLSGSNFVGSAARLGASPGKWWKVVDETWSDINKGKNMNALADILTDPKSAPVLKRIAAMPTGSREAGYLASRLLLQGKQAYMHESEPPRQ